MRKIHFHLHEDYTCSKIRVVDPKKRYGLLIALNSKTYYFSNKQKAERFLNQFSNFVTDSYKYYLQEYSVVNSSFIALFPHCSYVDTYKIREIISSLLDVFDRAFTSNVLRDNTVLINWCFYISENLIKVCQKLANVARSSRNQSEFTRIKNVQTSIRLYSKSFFDKYKDFEYKGKVSATDCEIIQLYSPLQLALNF